MNRISLVLLAILGAAPAAANEPRFDPEALTRAITPFCDEQTIAIVHINLWKVDRDQLVDKVVQFTKLARNQVARDTQPLWQDLAAFKAAAGKDAFVVASLADLPHAGFFVVPLYPDTRVDAVQGLGQLFKIGPRTQSARLHDALIFGDPQTLARLAKLQAKPSPALARAFAAAGDMTAQALLLPGAAPPEMIEQMLAGLPKELGEVPSSVLTRDILWAAAGVESAPHVKVRLVVQAQDAKAAAALGDLTVRQLKLASEMPPVRALFPNLGQLVPVLTPKVDGDRLVLTLEEPTLAAALLPVMQKTRAASGEAMHTNKLRQVAVAMHSFHDTHHCFPSHASYDRNGKPLLSWRVHLLPYLEEQHLYQQFHLDEPWDSAHNRALIPRMPQIYSPPPGARVVGEGKTVLMTPVGEETIFPDRTGGTQMQEIARGTSNTILLVEVTAPHAVIWTKPEDLNVNATDPLKGLFEPGQREVRAVFADGSFRPLPASIRPDELWEMFERGGPRQDTGFDLNSGGTRPGGRPWLLAALLALTLAVSGSFLARYFLWPKRRRQSAKPPASRTRAPSTGNG
jgi:hypothetical protein